MMDATWNLRAETDRYTALWCKKDPWSISHSAALWNERAEEWETALRSNQEYQGRSSRRINSTADYLRSQGLLRAGYRAVDIGCGPGRFVAAFAQTAEHVTGTDLSPRMTELGAQYTAEHGIENVAFTACDFKTVDIDEQNWRGQFDLVFASITPALSQPDSLDKMIAMSRAYCFNSTFVYSSDPVDETLLQEVFRITPRRRWDGSSFHAMFNLLWLKGYYPTVTYFKEHAEEYVPSDRSFAAQIAERYLPDAAESDIDKIHAYLTAHADKDGMLVYPSERWYAWVYWDVRDRCDRVY